MKRAATIASQTYIWTLFLMGVSHWLKCPTWAARKLLKSTWAISDHGKALYGKGCFIQTGEEALSDHMEGDLSDQARGRYGEGMLHMVWEEGFTGRGAVSDQGREFGVTLTSSRP